MNGSGSSSSSSSLYRCIVVSLYRFLEVAKDDNNAIKNVMIIVVHFFVEYAFFKNYVGEWKVDNWYFKPIFNFCLIFVG